MSTYSIRHRGRPPDSLRPLRVMLAAAVALGAVAGGALGPVAGLIAGGGTLYGDVQRPMAPGDPSPFDDDDGVDAVAADDFDVDDAVPAAAGAVVSVDRSQDGRGAGLLIGPRPHAVRHSAHVGKPGSRRHVKTAAAFQISRPVTRTASTAGARIPSRPVRTRAMGQAAWRRTRSWQRQRGGEPTGQPANRTALFRQAFSSRSFPPPRPASFHSLAPSAIRAPVSGRLPARHRAQPRVVNRRQSLEEGG